ncbi:MAG: flagellar hook protein FlgE [Bryobacteraceae bacterium]|jgi:flagellar hook protein FlgE
MFPAFTAALSALTADTAALDVTGNNLANLDTTGFKATQVSFADMMAESLGGVAEGSQVGEGVLPISTETNYTQGAITSTAVSTDAAIEGNGFFVLNNAANQTLYTRDGSFQTNASGYLVDANGNYVQGWLANGGLVTASGPTSAIQVATDSTSAATATANLSLNVNLDATSSGTANTFNAPIQVYDSLGNAQMLTVSFTQDTTTANTWDYTVTIPNSALTGGGAPGTTTSVTTGTLTFSSSGKLTDPAAGSPITLSVTGLADGAADLSVNWNLYNTVGTPQITQYAAASAVNSTSQDGFAAGELTGMTIGAGGTVSASYSNGQNVVVAQLALASIANPNTLNQVGNNDLQVSGATAAPVLGVAGSGSLGKIEGESLESSTVDMATEFTNLLAYQNSYQAASKVITISDQLMQDTANLIRS